MRLGNKKGGSNARPRRDTGRKSTREGRTGLKLDGGGQRIRLGDEVTSIAVGSQAGREEDRRNGDRAHHWVARRASG